MKILQLVTKRQYRGAEVFAANLSEEMLDLGHEVLFVGLYKNSVNVLEVQRADNRDLSESAKGLFSYTLFRKLIALIKETKPDIIQCNGSDTLKYSYLISFIFPKIPLIYRNISMISEWMGEGIKKKMYTRIFKRISHVSSVGEEAIKDLIDTFQYPPNKTSVIRRGIPMKKVDKNVNRAQLLSLLGLPQNIKIIMHIGNFSPEKNHALLLDIFSKIKLTSEHIKLVLVGEGVKYEEIRKLIIDKNLQNSVFQLGFRKDIPELLSTADCFVLTSMVEGVPGVILEAGSQRVPSVASNVGGTSEVLHNNETGYLIDDFNKNEFENRILDIITNKELSKRLGDNAFNLVNSEFNPKRNAKKFESLYKNLIAESKI